MKPYYVDDARGRGRGMTAPALGSTARARDIFVRRVERTYADACMRAWHYSGGGYSKSILHYGVFVDGSIRGAIQLGEGIDTAKLIGLVPGTPRDGYLEINRLAFSDELPRNSESRALGIVMRLLRRDRPQVQWVISFADGCQCGDGAIYRAAGFLLTQVRRNTTLLRAPDGKIVSDLGIRTSSLLRNRYGMTDGNRADIRAAGLTPLAGYQLRYMRFIDEGARSRLAVPVLSYGDIPADARMVRGQSQARVAVGEPAEPPPVGVRPDPRAPTEDKH